MSNQRIIACNYLRFSRLPSHASVSYVLRAPLIKNAHAIYMSLGQEEEEDDKKKSPMSHCVNRIPSSIVDQPQFVRNFQRETNCGDWRSWSLCHHLCRYFFLRSLESTSARLTEGETWHQTFWEQTTCCFPFARLAVRRRCVVKI